MSYGRHHGFGLGVASIALTSGNIALALHGHWPEALLLLVAGCLGFVVLLARMTGSHDVKPTSPPVPARLAPSRTLTDRIAAMFRPHAH